MTSNAGDNASEGETDEYLHRRAILEPAILNVVNALGGYEGGVYRLGDEAYGCLKDLKRFWRKDDADDGRTVARILWAARVLPNDLVPILLETAGKGHVEDKRALACADLIAAMTWPIDIAEELKELDELRDEQDPAAGAEYTELRQSHLHYKAALLRPGVLRALLALAVPCLARASAGGGRSGSRESRAAERDVQVVSVVLHVVRNLAFIADAPANVHLSADQAELASLQSRFVRALSEAHFLELLLAAAAGAQGDAMFNAWNTLLLEIFYLLFRGIRPDSLVSEQAEVCVSHCCLSSPFSRVRTLIALLCLMGLLPSTVMHTHTQSPTANETESATAADAGRQAPARFRTQSPLTSLAFWDHDLGAIEPKEDGYDGWLGSPPRRGGGPGCTRWPRDLLLPAVPAARPASTTGAQPAFGCGRRNRSHQAPAQAEGEERGRGIAPGRPVARGQDGAAWAGAHVR